MLGAADTFRAGAIDQLQIWADRVEVPLVRQEMGSDPASVAFDTLESAKAQGCDIVFIDTAGRLHNKVNLMNELTKVKRVMSKIITDAPHEVLLVLDGSTGQNAFEQAKQFTAATEVTSFAIHFFINILQPSLFSLFISHGIAKRSLPKSNAKFEVINVHDFF